MKAVTNYLKNVTKSVAYAASDVARQDLAPDIMEFADSNKEFAAATYANLRNPKYAIKKSVTAIQNSKVYQAIDYGVRNTFEDLRTGNFYNKERMARDELKLSGLDDGKSWDDLSDFGIDSDWEEKLGNTSSSTGKSSEVTAGDLKVVQAIEATTAASSAATVNAIAAASDASIKNSRANMGMIYMQNERLFGGLHKDLSILGATMDSMHKIASSSLQNIDKNSADFFTAELKLSTERNAMLREILEMQRNMYKSAADREKEAAAKSNSKRRTSWRDISSGGMPNLDAYFKAVKQNIANEMGSMLPQFSDDGNMLATFMVSPMQYVLEAVVKGIIPATVKQASKEFNDSVSGIFGNIIGRLGNARDSGNGLMGFIAKFLGVSTSVKNGIDTSRYEKGPVPFDGITRKAIIDVIPTYLRRIEAYITGSPEQAFDYRSGRWITMREARRQYDSIRKNAISSATSDVRQMMHGAVKSERARQYAKGEYAGENFDRAIEEFSEFLFNNNGIFNPNRSAADNGIDMSNYPHLVMHYEKIRHIYAESDRFEYKSKGGKIVSGNKYSTKMKLSSRVLDEKERANAAYREIESAIGPINQLMSSISHKFDTHGKWDEKSEKFDRHDNILLSTKDNLGNTIFNYLQELNKELTWQRTVGFEELITLSMIGGHSGGKRGGKGKRSANGYRNFKEYNERNHADAFNALSVANKRKEEERRQEAQRQQHEQEKRRREYDKLLRSGEAVSPDAEGQQYYDEMTRIIATKNSEEMKELLKSYDSDTVSIFFNDYFYKNKIRSIKDVQKALAEAEKRANGSEDKVDAKEKNFLQKVFGGIMKTGSIAGGVAGAGAEIFTDLLYTADKAVYEMMFKAELKDDSDGKKYDGFMDMMAGKLTGTFNKIQEHFKSRILEPFARWLGIDDKFKENFLVELKDTGKALWNKFVSANKEVYQPIGEEALRQLGLRDGDTIQQRKRKDARNKGINTLEQVKNMTSLYDPKFIDLLKEYDINVFDYAGDFNACKEALEKAVKERIYKNTKGFKEVDNSVQLKAAIDANADNVAEMRKIAESFGIHLPEDDTAVASAFASGMVKFANLRTGFDATTDSIGRKKLSTVQQSYKSKATRDRRNAALRRLSGGNASDAIAMAEQLGFIGSKEEKIKMINALDPDHPITGDEAEHYNDEALLKRFLRLQRRTFAKGTMGSPFMGKTMLSKNELLFNSNGISKVDKTGAYDITQPTHILNSRDSHPILEFLGFKPGAKSTVAEDLRKEKFEAGKNGFSIANHAAGSGGIKITNNGVDVDTKQVLGEAKKFIPEGAAGGLIGGILSLVLGLAGGPIVGAAAGAAGNIVRHSDWLKTKLFGEMGEDGRRSGEGLVNKKIVDAAQKYAPEMFKYGLAGIIPGLLTPLGPIGGLMAGAAFGFLKNNEKFTNKYFGEEGKLTIGSEEKEIISKMLPGALKGAGVGVVVGTLFGGPFGLLGNAALGSGLGMMTTTEEFKDAILGTEINGERIGGIVGIVKDAFAPLTDAMKSIKDKILDDIDRIVVDPLKRFIKPAIHALPKFLGGIVKSLSGRIESRLNGLHATFMHSFGRILSPITGFMGKTAKTAYNAAMFIPRKVGDAVGKTGDKLTAYNIARGDTMGMTQREAIEWMTQNGFKTNRHEYRFMQGTSKIGTEDGLSVDAARELITGIDIHGMGQEKINKDLRKANDRLNTTLFGFKSNSGKKIPKKAITRIIEEIKHGDPARIDKILIRAGLSQDEIAELHSSGGLDDAIAAAKGANDRNKLFNDPDSEKKIREHLDKLGIKDFDFNNKDHRRDLRKLLQQEVDAKDTYTDDEDRITEENNENIKTITDILREISENGIKVASGESEEEKQEAEKLKERLGLGGEYTEAEFAKLRAKAAEEYDSADGHNPGDFDKLSHEAQNDIVRAKGNGKLNKGGVRKASKMSNDAVNKAAEKGGSGINRASQLAEFSALITTDGSATIGSLSDDKFKTLVKRLKIGVINKLIKNCEYPVDKELVEFLLSLSTVQLRELITKCQEVYQAGLNSKKECMASIQDIYNMSLDDMASLREENPHGYNDNTGMVGANIGRGVKTAGQVMKIGIGKFRDAKKSFKNKTKSKIWDLTHKKLTESFDEEANKSIQSETVESHGIGTMLLGGLSWIGSKALGLGAKAVSGISNGISKLFSSDGKGKKKGTNPSLLENILGGSGKSDAGLSASKGDFDETDREGDKKDVVQLAPGKFGFVTRKNDGSVEPDTSDSKTKEIMNELTLGEKLKNKAQEAQMKSMDILKNAFDPENIQNTKKKGLNWLTALLIGGFLAKSGILGKLFNGLIKPLWTNHLYPLYNDKIKPFFTQTVPNWISSKWETIKTWGKETAWPWIQNTALPAVTNFISEKLPEIITNSATVLVDVISSAIGPVAEALLEKLPTIIWNGIKGIASGTVHLLDYAFGGNKTNVGAKTTVSADKMSDGKSYMTDENGNTLTKEDIANGNYEKIYNSEGVEGIVNEDGTITFEDPSLPGSGYASTMLNSSMHALAYGSKRGKTGLRLAKALSKGGNFLRKRTFRGPFRLLNLATKPAGYALEYGTKPINKFAEWGDNLHSYFNSKSANAFTSLIEEGKIPEVGKWDGAIDRVRNSKFGKAATNVFETASEKTSNVKKFVSGKIDSAKTKINNVKGAIRETKESAEKSVREALGGKTETVVKKGTTEVMEKAAGEGTEKVVKEGTETVLKEGAESAAKEAVGVATKAGSKGIMGKLGAIIEGLKTKIANIFKDNRFISKVVEKFGGSGVGKLLTKFKGCIDEAIEKGMKQALEMVAKKSPKLAARLAADATVIVAIVMAIADFAVGCDQAEAILRVESCNPWETIVAGLIAMVSGLLLGIPDMLPDSWIISTTGLATALLKLCGDDLTERREATEAAYQKFLNDSGSTLTKEEWLKKEHSVTGKIGYAIKDEAKKTWNKAKDIGKTAVQDGKALFNAITHPKETLNKGKEWAKNKIADFKKDPLGTLSGTLKEGYTAFNNTAVGKYVKNFTPIGWYTTGIEKIANTKAGQKVIGIAKEYNPIALAGKAGKAIADSDVGKAAKNAWEKTGGALINKISGKNDDDETPEERKARKARKEARKKNNAAYNKKFDEIREDASILQAMVNDKEYQKEIGIGMSIAGRLTGGVEADKLNHQSFIKNKELYPTFGAFKAVYYSDKMMEIIDRYHKKLTNVKKSDNEEKSDNTKGTTKAAAKTASKAMDATKKKLAKGKSAILEKFKTISGEYDEIIDVFNNNTKMDEDTNKKILKAKDGKLSIFSKDYWKSKLSNKKGAKSIIGGAYEKISKVMNLPALMIRTLFSSLGSSMDEIQSEITSTSFNTLSGKVTSKLSGGRTVTKSNSKRSGIIGSIKKLFGFGTMNAEYGMGYSKQNDPSIAAIRFNARGDSEYQTIGDSGCGPAAAVNALEAMYGRGTGDIVNAAKYAVMHGYKETDGGTRPQFFTDYFARNGYASHTTSSRSTLEANIRSGIPTVLMGQDTRGVSSSNPYGRTPHYVTATGIDSKGHVIVQDPESRYDNQLYSMNDLMSKTKFGISAFGKNIKAKFGHGRFGRGKYGRGKSTIIFVGDSRTVGMQAVAGNNSHIWSCKVGMGLNWMKSTGVPAIEGRITNDTAIVLLMGVNDMLGDVNTIASQYIDYYNSKIDAWSSKGADVYFVSVNPVAKNGYSNQWGSIDNDKVKNFNNQLNTKTSNKIKYINTFDQVYDTFQSSDGLHYDNATYKKIYEYICNTVSTGKSDGSSKKGNTSSKSSSSSDNDNSVVGILGNIVANSRVGKAFFNFTGIGNGSKSSGSSSSGFKKASSSTGNGNFPKYTLTEADIMGLANIVDHEQPGPEGHRAEASLIANRTDISGNDKATAENIRKTVTGGWFADGKNRFHNPGNPSADAIAAVKEVIVEGKRTLPRYIDEHDYLGDINTVLTDGSSVDKKNHSNYKQHQTVIKNNMGSTYTFYEFPNDKSDPFGYTRKENRDKWGESHYKYGTGKYGRGTNDSMIWWYLRQAGLTEEGAAGLMGNLFAESGLIPNNLQDSYESSLGMNDATYTKKVDDGSYKNFVNDSAGYGLAQWTASSRKQNLQNYIKDKNKSIASLEGQLGFLMQELRSGFANTYNTLKNATNVKTASNAVLHDFERPKDQSASMENTRASYGNKYYNAFKGKEGTPIDDAEVETDGSSPGSSDGGDAEDESPSVIGILSDILANSTAGKALSAFIGGSSGSSSSGSSGSSSGGSNGKSGAAMVEVARNEIGTEEKYNNEVKYNDWYYGKNVNGAQYPWCAAFVSWVANESGNIANGALTKAAYCPTEQQYILDHGGKKVATSDAKPGDIIYYGPGGQDHTGIVEKLEGSKLFTIEGNYGNKVQRRENSVSGSNFFLVRPAYSSSDTDVGDADTSDSENSGDLSIMGGNGIKPLSKFGQFRDSMYGRGITLPPTKRKLVKNMSGGYDTIEVHPIDQEIQRQMRSRSRKHVYGMGTGVTYADNSALISTIIKILYSIADNTDKLNTIVAILNNKLGSNITSRDIANATGSETLKAKLQRSLNNTLVSTSKVNSYADSIDSGSITMIINAMNAIAAE